MPSASGKLRTGSIQFATSPSEFVPTSLLSWAAVAGVSALWATCATTRWPTLPQVNAALGEAWQGLARLGEAIAIKPAQASWQTLPKLLD
jgi:hypothetical protein